MASRLGDQLPPKIGWVANLAAPWLAVAFFLGRKSSSAQQGAVAGAVSLLIATLTHYSIRRLGDDGLSAELFRHPVPMWSLIGGVGGAIFGRLGRITSERRIFLGVIALAALSAAFLSEAAFLLLEERRQAFVVAVPVAILCGLGFPLLVLPSRSRAVVAVLLGLFVIPVGILTIDLLQRSTGRVYWERH